MQWSDGGGAEVQSLELRVLVSGRDQVEELRRSYLAAAAAHRELLETHERTDPSVEASADALARYRQEWALTEEVSRSHAVEVSARPVVEGPTLPPLPRPATSVPLPIDVAPVLEHESPGPRLVAQPAACPAVPSSPRLSEPPCEPEPSPRPLSRPSPRPADPPLAEDPPPSPRPVPSVVERPFEPEPSPRPLSRPSPRPADPPLAEDPPPSPRPVPSVVERPFEPEPSPRPLSRPSPRVVDPPVAEVPPPSPRSSPRPIDPPVPESLPSPPPPPPPRRQVKPDRSSWRRELEHGLGDRFLADAERRLLEVLSERPGPARRRALRGFGEQVTAAAKERLESQGMASVRVDELVAGLGRFLREDLGRQIGLLHRARDWNGLANLSAATSVPLPRLERQVLHTILASQPSRPGPGVVAANGRVDRSSRESEPAPRPASPMSAIAAVGSVSGVAMAAVLRQSAEVDRLIGVVGQLLQVVGRLDRHVGEQRRLIDELYRGARVFSLTALSRV